MIITNNEAALKIPCTDANPEEIDEILSLLDRELANSDRLGRPGIGLAAIQCGIPKNVAIVRLGKYNIDLVNCHIQNSYDEFLFQEEACLSFPGRIENTMRFNEIHVVDNAVYPYSFIVSGLLAVVIQHELDHLNGITLVDKAIPKSLPKPNEQCFCGSKLKFKRCCQRKV